MAAFSSYSDLKSTVSSYLSRTDLDAMIPTFITMAELRLGRDLRLRSNLKLVTTSTVANDATVQIPSDFNQMRDIHINTTPTSTLDYETPSVFFRNARTTVTGKPTKYTILGNEFQFAPIPDGAYQLEMLYYAIPTALSDTNTTNLWLTTCPDLLLYAALGEAEPYLMNDSRLQTWASLYKEGVDSLTASDDQGEYSGTPLQITVANR